MGIVDRVKNIFGFTIDENPKPHLNSPVTPIPDDGSAIVESVGSNISGYWGGVLDLDIAIKSENDLIRRYREIVQYPDCTSAVENIVNEAIIVEDLKSAVSIHLDELDYLSPKVKDRFVFEFKKILKLLRFDDLGHDMFRKWYIDGRIYFQILIDPDQPEAGIQELRPIDPRKIKKVKDVQKQVDPATGVNQIIDSVEYFIYNDKGLTENSSEGIKMSLDSIISVGSGLIDSNSGMMLSYLHNSIKPVNQLKMMEDSIVIYRMNRSTERRVFYVDVGNMSKIKADQYLQEFMARFRNRLNYDATTGEIQNQKKHQAMVEDYWIPRRGESKSTEIDTLARGEALDHLEDIEYFQKKLYQALRVPLTRLIPNDNFSLGRPTEITRDEVLFSKFIHRLRKKFSDLFNQALKIQLISMNVIRAEEWDIIGPDIKYKYQEDNQFAEFKKEELMQGRINTLNGIMPYVGTFFSIPYIYKNVLFMSEEEMEEMQGEIQAMAAQHQQMRDAMNGGEEEPKSKEK